MERYQINKYNTTPVDGDFAGVYDERAMARDRAKVQGVKDELRVEAEKREKRSSFVGVERAELADAMEGDVLRLVINDIFAEWTDAEMLDGEDYRALRAQHTNEFDDYINHTDIVCVAKNALTEGRAIPFALDVTYNAKLDDIKKKMSWQHPVSGRPGVATLKYYADKNAEDAEDEILPRGRIDSLPRFVVGFNPDLLDEQTAENEDKKQLCILTELVRQSGAMLESRSGGGSSEGVGDAGGSGGASDLGGARDAGDLADLVLLDEYFRRAARVFEANLRRSSQDRSEMPMDEFYGQPDGYERRVKHYLSDNSEMIFNAIVDTVGTVEW